MAAEMCLEGNDPGTVRHGNFINYYKFNSAKSRVQLLPTDLWNARCDESFVCLDVGCNSGDLTQELYKFLSTNLAIVSSSVEGSKEKKKGEAHCHILGIDLDPVLIIHGMKIIAHHTTVLPSSLNQQNSF